jgi:glycosyltransferase involved in cell wall biosynthesis
MTNKTIKILVVVDHVVGISGPHRNVVSTLNALSARPDVSIELVTGKIDRSEPYASAPQTHIALGFRPKSFAAAIGNIFLILKARNKCDVCYVPTNLTSFLYAWLFKGHIPLVVGQNVTGIPLLMDIFNPSPLMTSRMCQAWVVNSELVAQFCERAGTNRKQINIIPHGIEFNRFMPSFVNRSVWKEWDISEDDLIMLHVGRANEKRKGFDILFEAFELAKKQCHKLHFVFIGTAGPFLTNEMIAAERFHYAGKRYWKELAVLYASADFFVGISSWETFWFTPLEAMASGLPVIVSNTGVVPLMIPNNGSEGIILDIIKKEKAEFLPDVSNKVADAIVKVSMDSAMRKDMGYAARKWIEKAFNTKDVADKLVQVFHKVLKDKSSFNKM